MKQYFFKELEEDRKEMFDYIFEDHYGNCFTKTNISYEEFLKAYEKKYNADKVELYIQKAINVMLGKED